MDEKYVLNCWKPPKANILQHRDEISSSVNVAKAEKNISMMQGYILNIYIMGNQQPSLE